MDKPVHPAAAILPLMVGDEFAALVLDIRAHGLRDPIVLHPDGSILDGRNRYRACQKAEVEPRYIEWKGAPGSEVAFVISENLHRRHLDASQRAMYFARFATRKGERSGSSPHGPDAPMTNEEAAGIAAVGVNTIKRARLVRESGDEEMIRAVESGEVDVTTASKIVQKTPAQISRRKTYEKQKAREGIADIGVRQREQAGYMKEMLAAIDALSALPDPADFIPMMKILAGNSQGRKPIDQMLNRLPAIQSWITDFQQKWSAYVPSRSKGSAADEA